MAPDPPPSRRFPGELVEQLHRRLLARGENMAVAESCTGGLLGAAITARAGSSEVFLGGVVAYHDRIKRDLLGVAEETLREHGAVSEATARAMARGVRERFGADLAASVTGVAGPGGGRAQKPVGLVYVGVADRVDEQVRCFEFDGDRSSVRFQSVRAALKRARDFGAPGTPA